MIQKGDLFIAVKRDDYEEIKDAFLSMLNQACGEWKDGKFLGYDSMCLGSYESGLDLAVRMGWITKEEVRR